MSMMVYGVQFTQDNLRENAAQILASLMPVNMKNDLDAFEVDFLRDNPELTHADAVECFVDEYADASGIPGGITTCIRDVINGNEFPHYHWFQEEVGYGAYQIFVYPYIPATRACMISVEDIDRCLHKYVGPLLKEDAVIDWFELGQE